MQKNYVQEILDIIHSGLPEAERAERLSDYHENDIADALAGLTAAERRSFTRSWAWIRWPRSSPIWMTRNPT